MNQQTNFPATPETSPLVTFWNEVLAPKFTMYRHILVDGLSRHSAAILPTLQIAPGDRILDVGCGFGDTVIALGNRVGSTGSVMGVDCCEAFITQAWDHAEKNWAENVRFAVGDVERGVDGAPYDFVFARFGTMFFANPVAGLRAMRVALKPGGKMAHIVWRDRKYNPWLNAAKDIVQQFLPKPGEDALTCGPGPFSMSDERNTRAKMEAAGFTDIRFKRIDAKVMVGRNVQEAIAFQLALGPAGETFREAGDLGEEKREEIEAALAEMFSHAETTADGLWMDSSSWLITARNPA
ncbi:class I SAM-dependent methyltransferase [Sulfitobacter sp. SK011]|uniref:class I SAM-dependent methyltransferase n=1 Tax=Sulfitobacter sp. SK011 TaxID=1389004 RepID=UPI001966B410|nr:class I SAM-dependent methyltransferase [Sulfitobacter sp. SK011]